MLFAFELLCGRPKGKFATIWCLANGIKVSNRDVMKISILQTVKEIQKMIVEKAPHDTPISTRNQLSIYLSAKLCRGTAIAFDLQLDNFIADLTKLMTVKPLLEKQKKAKEDKTYDAEKGKGKKRSIPKEEMPKQDITQGDITYLEIPDIAVELARRQESTSVRVDVREITLPEFEADIEQQEENNGFGEPVGQLPDIRFFSPEGTESHQLLGEEDVSIPAGIKTPDVPLESQILPSTSGSFVPEHPEITAFEPLGILEPEVLEPPVEKSLPAIQTSIRSEVEEQIETEPAEISEIAPQKSPLITEISAKPESETKLHEEAMVLEKISPIEEGRKRRKGKRFPHIDAVIEISKNEILEGFVNSSVSLKVQYPHEELMQKKRNRIPAKELLNNVRGNIHLKTLVKRHYVTSKVADDISDIDLLRAGEISHGEVNKTQPPDVITTDLEVPQTFAPEKEATVHSPSILQEEVQLETIDERQVLELETIDERQVLETEPTDIQQHELLDIRRESPVMLQDDVAATGVARMEETSTAPREEELESIEKSEVIVELEKSPESFIRLCIP